MRFGFDERTRELLKGIWAHGSVSAAASAMGMDPGNASRHLKTAEKRVGVRLVERRPGGRGGKNATLTSDGRRLLDVNAQVGYAHAFDQREGVTPVRVGGRILHVAGRARMGPAELEIRPESVALERPSRQTRRSSIRNRLPARVEAIEPMDEGIFRVSLTAGTLVFHSLVVRGALRELRLRRGSRVVATIKAVSLVAAPIRPETPRKDCRLD